MNSQTKTVVCPNCGSNATNLQNCEYCGSALVRMAVALQDDGAENILEEFQQTTYINPNILKGLQEAIEHSKRYNIDTVAFFGIHNFRNYHFKIIRFNYSISGESSLCLKFNMDDSWQNGLFSRVEDRAGSLFSMHQDGNHMLCSLQLDGDLQTTTKLIEYIIKEVFIEDVAKISIQIGAIKQGKECRFITTLMRSQLEEKAIWKINFNYQCYIELLNGVRSTLSMYDNRGYTEKEYELKDVDQELAVIKTKHGINSPQYIQRYNILSTIEYYLEKSHVAAEMFDMTTIDRKGEFSIGEYYLVEDWGQLIQYRPVTAYIEMCKKVKTNDETDSSNKKIGAVVMVIIIIIVNILLKCS